MARPVRIGLSTLRPSLFLAASLVLLASALADMPVLAGAATLPAGHAGTPLPICAYRDVLTRFRDPSLWRKTLLDTTKRVGRQYHPDDLVPAGRADIAGGGMVRSIVIKDLKAMASAARRADAGIAVQSAYRSYASQKQVFAGWVARLGYEEALRTSARPGHSEHQLGTTIDFRSASSSTAPWDYQDWGDSAAGGWMRHNAWKYGWVMSYPAGKSRVTCYEYEPWHFRYVGRAEAADVHASGQVLRRYLWETFETAGPS